MLYVTATSFLPDDKLRELAKCEDLRAVSSLQFSVDTSENSLSDLGQRLPALTQLRLDGSNVATLRDLGTGLGGLRVLWLARSGLCELEGFGSLPALAELYLAFNEVHDLSPLMGAERLQVLDLEANAVAAPDQVHYLASCDELHSLTLEGNPITDAPEYHDQVVQALPQLRILDDIGLIGGESSSAAASSSALDDDEEDEEGLFGPAAAPAASSSSSSSVAAVDDTTAAAARRRELRLVRDGIKYTDALRTYDVTSHEALAMGPESVADTHREGDGLSSRSSATGDPYTTMHGHGGGKARVGGSATSQETMSTTPGGSERPSTSSSALASLRARAMTASAASSRLTTATSHRSGTSSLGHAAHSSSNTSLLTFGDDILVCGNPTQALRAKREKRNSSKPSSAATSDSGIITGIDGAEEEVRGLLESLSSACGTPNSERLTTPASRVASEEAAAAMAARRKGRKGPATPEAEAAAEFLEALYRYKLESAIQGDHHEVSSGNEHGSSGDEELVEGPEQRQQPRRRLPSALSRARDAAQQQQRHDEEEVVHGADEPQQEGDGGNILLIDVA